MNDDTVTFFLQCKINNNIYWFNVFIKNAKYTCLTCNAIHSKPQNWFLRWNIHVNIVLFAVLWIFLVLKLVRWDRINTFLAIFKKNFCMVFLGWCTGIHSSPGADTSVDCNNSDAWLLRRIVIIYLTLLTYLLYHIFHNW